MNTLKGNRNFLWATRT